MENFFCEPDFNLDTILDFDPTFLEPACLVLPVHQIVQTALNVPAGTIPVNLAPEPVVYKRKPVKRKPISSIGKYSPEERREKIIRYKQKRKNIVHKVQYPVRKKLADNRPRVGGRFVASNERVVTPLQ